MTTLAVTVVSHDRPGLIADVTEVLAERGGNLTSSSMSLLQGHFAWTLVVEVGADVDELRDALLRVCPRGVNVLELDQEASSAPPPVERLIVTLHGADRIGLVAAVTRALADRGGNIVELATQLHAGFYICTAEVDFGARVDVAEVDAELKEVGAGLGVSVTVRRADPDVL